MGRQQIRVLHLRRRLPDEPYAHCHRCSLVQRLAHGHGCAADLAVDGGGGHWAYVTLESEYNAACTLLPLPEHASNGTCTGGDIPKGGRCDPQVRRFLSCSAC